MVNEMVKNLIFLMKEPDYNILIISTFSGLSVPEVQKEDRSMVNVEEVKFKYPEVVDDYCRFRGVVENHNVLRHDNRTKSQICLHSAWGGI